MVVVSYYQVLDGVKVALLSSNMKSSTFILSSKIDINLLGNLH